MTRRHRLVPATLLALLALSASACDRIESALVERAASRALTGNRDELLKDGNLNVVLCGTGSPITDAERASACTAILAGGHFIIVDAGPGSQRNIALWRLPRAHLEAILLTHFHSDHIGEVGEATLQSWIAGRTAPLAVYGPPGVEQVVDGFRQAYAFDTQYRVVHHGEQAMPAEAARAVAHTVDLPGPQDEAVVFDADGLRVVAFAVDHAPVAPAYGYRADYRGRSVVISGDTKKSENLIRHAHDADLLVHEALAAAMIKPVTQWALDHGLARWAKLTSDVVNYHTTPIEAAEVARAADVRMLVFTHLVPSPSNFIARRMFLRGVSDAWNGKIVLGKDGMHFKMSPGETSIAVDTID